MMDAIQGLLLNETIRIEKLEYKQQLYTSLHFAFKHLYNLVDSPEEHILVIGMMQNLERLEEIKNDR